MPHMGKGKEIAELLWLFAVALEAKLRRKKIPAVKVGRAKELRWDAAEYLQMCSTLNAYLGHESKAKVLEPEYMRQAALKAVREAYDAERVKAVRLLAGILTDWSVVDALAEAFAAFLRGEKTRKESGEPDREVLLLRYLIHLAPAKPINTGHAELVREYVDKVSSQFGPGSVQIEDAGWMLGSLASTDEIHGTPDGVFMIVRVVDTTRAFLLKGFLQVFCAGRVSMVELFNEGHSPLNENVGYPDTD